MFNRNRKRLSAEVFSSAQKQPKQTASNQNREENGSTTLRNTREKPLLAGYGLVGRKLSHSEPFLEARFLKHKSCEKERRKKRHKEWFLQLSSFFFNNHSPDWLTLDAAPEGE